MLTNFLAKLPQKNIFLSLSSKQHRYNHSCSNHKPPEPEAPKAPEPFETLRREEFKRIYSPEYKPRIPGQATTAGTKKYSTRNPNVSKDNFRKPYRDDLSLSTIGYGSYVGAPDEIDDLKMFNGLIETIESGGVNVIDTAINYRYQKSERVVGAVLRYLLEKGYSREELFICSKVGYISEDADRGVSGQMLTNTMIEEGKITEEDIVAACHCLHPNYLEDQLERTLSNIGLEKLDLYYIHNSVETQLPLIEAEKFRERLSRAFEFCEEKVQKGKIGAYGMATWMCFRAKTEEDKIYMSIQEAVELAEKVGGKEHNFKYIQLPVNMIMPEAFGQKWQEYKEGDKVLNENVFQVARRSRVNVITSSPLAQGQLGLMEPPKDVFKMSSIAAKHIQFARSIPAEALLTTLVGQKTNMHVKNNLEVVTKPVLPKGDWIDFFKTEEGN